MPSPTARIRSRRLRACLLACVLACPAPALAAGAPDTDTPGTHMPVTPQKMGAGAVSSGVQLPPAPPATGTEALPVPAWGGPLPYPVVIADRRNNRLIEVTPDKRIVWEFASPDLSIYRGNDDVFFSHDGNRLMVNEEDNYDIHTIDYASRTLIWSHGEPDTKGRGPDQFDFPDDAHLLPDGSVVTTDIRNCRIMFFDVQKVELIEQWGKPGDCRHDPPRAFALPNGVTPLEGGDLLITEIPGSWITRLTRQGGVVWALPAPHVAYPSDAYPTRDGQVIVADYVKPGGVVIFDPHSGKATWEYRPQNGEAMLDHPSLAIELPNRNVLLNDDHRQRVVVIDRQTGQIVWQYGVTDQPGHAPGMLFNPDGLDVDFFHDWQSVPPAG